MRYFKILSAEILFETRENKHFENANETSSATKINKEKHMRITRFKMRIKF